MEDNRSPDVTIWQYVDATEEADTSRNATASGVQPPAGEFSTNIGALNSETSGQRLDDLSTAVATTPRSAAATARTPRAYLNLPTLDMSGLESVVIGWDQYLRLLPPPLPARDADVEVSGRERWRHPGPQHRGRGHVHSLCQHRSAPTRW